MIHLGIAFIMGLFTFGLIMCVSYILFFRDEWAEATLRLISLQRWSVIKRLFTNSKTCQAVS